MNYLLMNKDNPVAKFSVTKGLIGDVYTLSHVSHQKMPIGFQDIQRWIDNRKGSKHNTHLKKIMEMCECEKTEGFIRITHAASINDTFWIKNEEETISWKDVSFYHNEFNETISKLAFEGVGLYGIQLKMSAMANHDEDYDKRYAYLKECIDMLETRKKCFMDPLEMEYYFKICGLICFNCAVQKRSDYEQVIYYGNKAVDFYYNYIDDTSSFYELYEEDAEKYREVSKKWWNLKQTYQCMAIVYREMGDWEQSEMYWRLCENED